MKYDKFFDLAKEAGIEEAELFISRSYSLSVSLFHGQIENNSMEDGMVVIARGIVNGKFGSARCDTYNAEKAKYLVKEIVSNAKVIENEDPVFIFEGSPKYKKIKTYNRELDNIPLEQKLEKLFVLEKLIKEGDERIVEVASVDYCESKTETTIINSRGLNLHDKSNFFYYVGQAVAKLDTQTKSGFDLAFGNDFAKFDPEELAKKVIKETVAQLGGEACESKTYKAVLAPEVVAKFMNVLVNYANAESVQKNSSLFIGKLNQKVVSKKITILDMPHNKTLFSRWFDDEGVSTYNKPIIKNGVLSTYLYNLTTAAKDGVTTTGNASLGGSKMGVSPSFLLMKPGKKSQEELFQDVNDGVYITDIQGLHAGLNPQSGNFSLQSTGFLIKEGKIDRALDVITISGNILTLFNDVVSVGNDNKVLLGGASTPSLEIKRIAVSGK